MKALYRSIILVVLVLLYGCATTPTFGTRQEFWSEKDKVIGVAVAKISPPATYKEGAQGLLDVAINNGMASDLDKYLATVDTSKINTVADRIANYLSGKGYKVKRISAPIDVNALAKFEAPKDAKDMHFPERDFGPLKNTYGVDKIVLISARRVGTVRNYYGFVPLGAPRGLCDVGGQVINLSNNNLEWNQVTSQVIPVEGDWDTPPSYPALTKAVGSAVEQSTGMLYNNFAQ